jgi:hypothetical protein
MVTSGQSRDCKRQLLGLRKQRASNKYAVASPGSAGGPTSASASWGHGARGQQRARPRLGIFFARPCSQPRLSLGGGRHRRLLRPPSMAVPRARTVEWARPNANLAEGGPVSGRNYEWPCLYNEQIMSMADEWECSWHAAWELAFHRVVFAPIDPASAKEQLVLLIRQWDMHPNGQLPVNEPGATSTRRRTLGRHGASIRWTARRMAGRAVHIRVPVAGGNGAEGREPLVRTQTLWCGAKLTGCCGLVGKHRRHDDCGG